MAMPLVLVIMAGLLVLVLAMLFLCREKKQASRAWLSQCEAQFAVDAGLHAAMAQMAAGMTNDDFIIIESPGSAVEADGHRRMPLLQWLRGDVATGSLNYRRMPLFSASRDGSHVQGCGVAERSEFFTDASRMATLDVGPGNRVEVEWIALTDECGRKVADYAYWVEDLQGRLDPQWAGNTAGSGGQHQRVEFPIPASGPVDRWQDSGQSAMNQVSLESLVPRGSGEKGLQRMRSLIKRRDRLGSPESLLWNAGFRAPMHRLSDAGVATAMGDLKDPLARRIEASMITGLQSYEEQLLVPYVDGVDISCMGKPQLHLNQLLGLERSVAVDRMASWIAQAMPDFDQRGGGFPDDYLKALAANALDYADVDDMPSGDGLGMDSHPWISEVVLQVHFQGLQQQGARWVMKWRMRLFVELWNMSNQVVDGGQARVSYEVNLRPTVVGYGSEGLPFDEPGLLSDKTQAEHQLELIGEKYYSPPFEVVLRPDEYRFYEVAVVDYAIDCVPQLDAGGQPMVETFDLAEPEEQMRGVELLWNGVPVHRIPKMVRDPYGLSDFRTNQSRKATKACIAGLNYGVGAEFANNLGDPRVAAYCRQLPLGENASPENVSPHRRNVRRRNIYDRDSSPAKVRHYGRVLPSQWPDGGHDSDVGLFTVTTSDAAVPTDPVKWPLSMVPEPLPQNAPMRISNAGRFGSVVELAHVHDPLMWRPAYADVPGELGSGEQDTRTLMGHGLERPQMPDRRQAWPEVTWSSLPSGDYGGGNTLRIGRAEHERFDRVGMRASHLLDLFCVGDRAADASSLRWVTGQVNINTAGRDVLRAMVHGAFLQDPGLCRVIDPAHDLSGPLHEMTRPWLMTTEEVNAVADRIADAVVARRPFVSLSQISHIRDIEGAVLGAVNSFPDSETVRWSDAAAEESYARLFESATVRSRNFRIWVVGRMVDGTKPSLSPRAEVRRVFTVFVDPGQRHDDGSLDPTQARIRILHQRDF